MKPEEKKGQQCPEVDAKKGMKSGRNFKHRKSVKEIDSDLSSRGMNDASWYSVNEQLLRDAASLPYSNMQGIPVQIDPFGMALASLGNIARISYIPHCGRCLTPVDAANLMTRNMYTFIRSQNSGAKNYEPAEVGILLFAIADCFRRIAEGERLYGVMRLYSLYQRGLPKNVVEALGFTYASVVGNEAQIRWTLNRLVLKLGSLAIPGDLSLLKRWIWAGSYLFKDSDSMKASIYAMVGQGGYHYTTIANIGTTLEFHEDNLGGRTIQSFLASLEADIDAIIGDADANIISGDILKAYGASGLLKSQPLPEDYFCAPVYQKEVLTQIHNLIPVGTEVRSPRPSGGVFTEKINITQVNGMLYSALCVGDVYYTVDGIQYPIVQDNTLLTDSPDTFVILQCLLDMDHDDPTPADNIVATRLTTLVENRTFAGTGGYANVTLLINGTEFVTNVVFFGSDDNQTTVGMNTASINGFNVTVTCLVTQFDWHPMYYDMQDVNVVGDTTHGFFIDDYKVLGVWGDLYNFTVLPPQVLSRMHDTAIISELTFGNVLDKTK